MGRLAGFRYRDVAQRLRVRGFVLLRSGKGSHEIWVIRETGRQTVLVTHPGDTPEGTLRDTLKLAGVTEDDFLA